MAGFIPHIVAGLTTALILHYFHQRFEFSATVFIGNLLPDALKFGISGIYQGTLKIFSIKQDGLYHSLDMVASDLTNWLSLGFVIFTITLFLFHFHYIKKKTMEEYDELIGFLILGIITHLVMDLLIIEKGALF